MPARRGTVAAVLLALAGLLALRAQAPLVPGTEERLEAVGREIARLTRELDALRRSEGGVLADVERLDAEGRLARARLEQVRIRLEEATALLAGGERRLGELQASHERRRRELALRLRELYKSGRGRDLQRLLAGTRAEAVLRTLRTAAYLGERDAAALRAHRKDRRLLAGEREALMRDREKLAGLVAEAEGARASIERARRDRARVLEGLRRDVRLREEALAELDAASRDLARLSGESTPAERLDVRRFRGLLDWPVAGRIVAPFGASVHPRFGTSVPHPGLDLAAAQGEPFHAVFDGHVVFAAPLRGYGLTAIVDHGRGVASVYAHAGALLVEKGQRVLRGQPVGHVGELADGAGIGLYFEIRDGGRPVDPVPWLRPRAR